MDTDPMYLKRNPQVFIDMLYALGADISSSISRENMPDQMMPWVNHIDQTLETTIKKSVDEFWVDLDLNAKIKQLVKKSDANECKAPAWRPTTGVVDMKPLEAYALERKKKLLQKRLAEERELTNNLECCVRQSRQELDQLTAEFIMLSTSKPTTPKHT